MRDIASNYARAFQLKMQTTGHLFERRYHATLIDVDVYLLAVLRYIHLNPVAAGLVRNVSEYRWSSHRAYAEGLGESWLTTDFALSMFAQTRARARAAYCRFVDAALAGHLDEPQLGAGRGGGLPGRQQAVESRLYRQWRGLWGAIGPHCAMRCADMANPPRSQNA